IQYDVTPAELLIKIVYRIQEQGGIPRRRYAIAALSNHPPSIVPKQKERLKLLDIDPLELARQLTLLESKQYNSIKTIECLARARDELVENDSIQSIITTTNKIASWVAFSVLEKDEPRRRGYVIRHFIRVAEVCGVLHLAGYANSCCLAFLGFVLLLFSLLLSFWNRRHSRPGHQKCRALHNYSSMAALVAGLNSPPIRRLKRTWDLVPAKLTAILDDLEATLDSGRNFTVYKQKLKATDSPCVPIFGVYLMMLALIQEGYKDFIDEERGIINFRKHQKIAVVIREIQRYQDKQYNLLVVDQVQMFIERSLAGIEEKTDYWETSMVLESQKPENMMTRLLQRSGFL
ncbi:unnamed protein product, partial [Rhizoctonia solani]